MVCFQEKTSSYKILLMISRSNKSSRKSISLYRTKRILIVDYDSDVALTFKKPLKKKIEIVTTRLRSKLKHTIILFRLFRSLIQTFYDLMFIDIHMPVMNGIWVCEDLGFECQSPRLLHVFRAHKSRSTKRKISIIKNWILHQQACYNRESR